MLIFLGGGKKKCHTHRISNLFDDERWRFQRFVQPYNMGIAFYTRDKCLYVYVAIVYVRPMCIRPFKTCLIRVIFDKSTTKRIIPTPVRVLSSSFAEIFASYFTTRRYFWRINEWIYRVIVLWENVKFREHWARFYAYICTRKKKKIYSSSPRFFFSFLRLWSAVVSKDLIKNSCDYLAGTCYGVVPVRLQTRTFFWIR